MSGDELTVTPVMIGIWVVIAVAVLTALIKAWPVISRAVTILDVLSDLPKRLRGIEQTVQAVHHEVFPNSGTSMRDAVNRVERQTGSNTADITEIKHTLDAHVSRQTAALEIIAKEKRS